MNLLKTSIKIQFKIKAIMAISLLLALLAVKYFERKLGLNDIGYKKFENRSS